MSSQYNRQQQSAVPFPTISDTELKAIIAGADEIQSARLTDTWGEKLGKASARVAASQIRNIFSKVRQIEMYWPADVEVDQAGMRELILLKPKLRYQTARKNELEDLAQLLIRAINEVQNRTQFQRFADFFEAILAYHKAAGGK